MRTPRSVPHRVVESVDPALPAALAWQNEDMNARGGIDVLGAFVAGARDERSRQHNAILRWVDQARACLKDQRLKLVDLCLQEIKEYAGRVKP